jgi:hypothetical protein
MTSLIGDMLKVVSEQDLGLAERYKVLETRVLLKKLDQLGKKDELLRRLLGEYRVLEAYHDKLKNSHGTNAGKLTLESDYPRIEGKSYTSPVLPDAIRKKPWSWNRIYRYTALHKRGPYTEDDVKTIAKFDMVQLNFSDKDLAFVRRLKKHNPDIICIGYRNVIIWHETFDTDLFRDHPDWFLKNFRTGEYETHGRTGRKAKKPLFDMRVPAMRDWWIEDVGKQCESDEFDGILIDAITKVLSNWGPKRRAIGSDTQSKMEYSKLFVDEVLKRNIEVNGSKGLIMANALRSGYDDCLKSYVDVFWHGSYMEWIESKTSHQYEELLGRLIDTCIEIGKDPEPKFLCFQFSAEYPPPPKVDVKNASHSIPESSVMPAMGEHFNTKNKTDDYIAKEMREAFPYKLAIFLICANKHSYMGYASSHKLDDSKARWAPDYPEFLKTIGSPKGHAEKKGKYYYEREFEHVSVKLNIETREAVLSWK